MAREKYTAARDALLGGGYRMMVKPILFRLDPERVHDAIGNTGAALGHWSATRWLTRTAFDYQHPMLQTSVAGINFANPVGLSAGFDKEGRLVEVLPEVGFGFMEIGSITGSPGPGNPKPRLWRLPKSKALVVYLGLNSRGATRVAHQLQRHQPRIPMALSIAKANLPVFDGLAEGIGDYVRAAQALAGLGRMRVINISCPNTAGGEPFQQPENLVKLLVAVRPYLQHTPVFIKLPADEDFDRLTALVDVAKAHGVRGFICTNLSRDRSNPRIRETVVPPNGGISGKVIEQRSNEILLHVYRITNGRMPIIGVGGIFTAEDAYRKIRLGASLVQLITGMVYRGPSVVSEIKRGLVRLLRRDGFTAVAEAVGADA